MGGVLSHCWNHTGTSGGSTAEYPPPNPQVWVGDGHCPPPPPDPLCGGPHSVLDAPGRGASSDPPPHPPGIAWRWAVPPISAMWGSPFCARGSGGGESRTPPPIPPGIGWRWALTPRSPMRGSTFCAGGSGGGAQDPPTPPGVGWGWAVPPRSYEGVPVLCGRLWGGLQDPSPPFRYRLEMGSAPPDLCGGPHSVREALNGGGGEEAAGPPPPSSGL